MVKKVISKAPPAKASVKVIEQDEPLLNLVTSASKPAEPIKAVAKKIIKKKPPAKKAIAKKTTTKKASAKKAIAKPATAKAILRNKVKADSARSGSKKTKPKKAPPRKVKLEQVEPPNKRQVKLHNWNELNFAIPLRAENIPEALLYNFGEYHCKKYEVLVMFYGEFICLAHLPMFIDLVRVEVEKDKTYAGIENLTKGAEVADNNREISLQYLNKRYHDQIHKSMQMLKAMGITPDRIKNSKLQQMAMAGITSAMDDTDEQNEKFSSFLTAEVVSGTQ